MFKMLVDTCVWLDVAKDPKQVPVVGVIEEMVKQKLIERGALRRPPHTPRLLDQTLVKMEVSQESGLEKVA